MVLFGYNKGHFGQLDITMRCYVQVTDTLHICLPRACQGGGRVGRSGVPGSIVNLSYELIINN